ncbi:putative nucleotidyltransferase, ribonuclease H [Tanacetum coccineum]
MEEPMLRLPDVTMPFKLHMEASEFAIEGVLMQDGHPITIESRKLNETERRYTVQEKEMTVVVYCLRIWRHYLLGLRFVINTDNIAMSYFQTRKKLSPKQARWQDFLAEFDYQLEYKPRKANVVADSLSRDRLYVPKWGSLKKVILKECYDSKWAGYPGSKRTLALVKGTYYWPRMKDDVETFMQTCLICQQDNIEQKKLGGLLEPLSTPKGPRESVSIDFITWLAKSEGSGSIIVVVDRLSKYGTFIATPPDVTTDDMTKLFFKNVAKLLDVAQFSYNMQHSEATRKSPFELVTGRQPLRPNDLAASYKGSSRITYKTMKE